ncbi:UNKNOWN [Stylonychia lemnae]|uniref:Uncharacterized protein n=1 Tax=Stylonychia lemnae TaxID=5949 RepID=A0A078ARE3_STYLE|nr:UNKNOWN [Stylonychia lemnae]|eukprot:CDW84551.1 UNKNOWN [Stylonychia lemnae]
MAYTFKNSPNLSILSKILYIILFSYCIPTFECIWWSDILPSLHILKLAIDYFLNQLDPALFGNEIKSYGELLAILIGGLLTLGYIGVLMCLLNLGILISLFIISFNPYKEIINEKQQDNLSQDSKNEKKLEAASNVDGYNFIRDLPSFSYSFFFQYYFLVIYQYLGNYKRQKSGYFLSVIANLIILAFVLLFCFFSTRANIVISSTKAIANQQVPGLNQNVIQSILFTASILQISFAFFLGKEFVLTLYDELKNKSLSNKIEDLRQGLSQKSFSNEQLKMVRKQIYQLVRMPYSKMNNTQFYSITCSYYFISVMIAGLFGSSSKDKNKGEALSSIVNITSSIVQPTLMSRLRYFALAFSIIGVLASAIFTTIGIYWQIQ